MQPQTSFIRAFSRDQLQYKAVGRFRPTYRLACAGVQKNNDSSNLSACSDVPLIDNFLPGNNEDAVMQINARTDVVGNDS
jgi:hypothetical protein